ncbi:MAG: iron-sulfur cluster assembly scaffold protein [Acidobacteria bacterium]|jgi:NifU-like protein|nr:iron-sulfur cluster assembly scaffold protein [Acidobacteriota bacterium]
MTWNYSQKTTDLFMAAVQGKPGTHLGEIEEPDGFGEHGSIACGDALRFTFRVERHPNDPKQDKITEARYLTFGCTSAIAASEALCAIIEEGDYTPIEALNITNKDIVNYLEGLPQAKIHCSVMGAEALEAAVFNWAQKRGVDLAELGVDISRDEQEEGRLVCTCFGLTEPYIERKIEELELKSIPEITNAIKAGGACMSCHHTPGGLQDLLNKVWGKQPTAFKELPILPMAREPKAELPRELSPFKFAKLVETVLNEHVRPQLARDGGDLEIVDIKDRVVYVELKGACSDCIGSTNTIKLLVEQVLKDRVDERIRVIQV